jgi:hypothetical protein
MNAGFSSLKELKAALLAEVLRDGVEYDDALTTIGLGVVVQFEKFCNRAFIRTVADTAKFSAARETYTLPRYPVEEVTAIAIQSDYATGWVAESLGLIANVNLMSGVVRFGGVLGTDLDQVRLTYTGGYFWNTNEDSTDALPTGATALPADLKLAWIEQCKKIWEVYDPLGTGLGKTATESLLTNLELLPTVKQTLTPHVRYQLT